MNKRVTMILGVFALLALAYVLFEYSANITTEEAEQRSKKLFPDMKAEQGIKLEIKKGDLTLLCEKADDKWKMLQPLAVRADKSEIDSIFSAIEFLEKAGEVKAEEGKTVDPAAYGFKKPEVQVTFWLAPANAPLEKKEEAKNEKQGAGHGLILGDKAVDNKIYVMIAGKPQIYAVADSVLDKLNKSANDLRDKTVIEIEKPNVEKLELAYASGKALECAKDKAGWKEVRPAADLAETSKVEELIDKLKDLKVEKDDFVTENDKDLAKFGLDKPELTAAVYQKGAAKTVVFGKKVEGKADKVYAKRKEEPSIFAVKNTIITDLTKDPNDLRDKRVCRLDSTDDVTKIELVEGNVQVVLEKKDSDWKITKPQEEKADQPAVKAFVDAVDQLSADGWAADKADDLAKYGLKDPAAAITLTLKGDKGVKKFLIGKKDDKGKGLYVKREGTDPILLVRADFEKKLAVPTLAFRDKTVLQFAMSDAKSLSIKRPDNQTVLAKNAGEGKWEMEQPIKYAADKTAVDDILYDLTALNAERYVAESAKDLKPYGLDAPRIAATIEYDQEVKKEEKKDDAKKDEKAKKEEKKPEKKRVSKTLLIGQEDPDKALFAKLADGDLIFTVKASVSDHLLANLASRDMMKFKKDDAKKIVLAYPDKEIVIEKKGNDWQITKPESKPFKTADSDDILNTLSDMRADALEAYTVASPAQYGLDKPQLKITVTVPEGEKTLIIGKAKEKEANKLFAQAPPSNFVYVVGKDTADKLMKEKPQPPKPAAPEKKAEPAKKTEAPKPAPAPAKPAAPAAPLAK